MCPTWQWKPAVDEKHKRAELPDDKQYLYTRVPCQKRVKDVMELKTVEKDLGDGWSLAENEADIKTLDEAVNKCSRNRKELMTFPVGHC